MKILIIICTVLLLTSCSNTEDIVRYPNDVTRESLNGYRTKATQSQTRKTVDEYFIVNTDSKKFHISSCAHARKIGEADRLISNDRDKLIQNGYKPCGICLP